MAEAATERAEKKTCTYCIIDRMSFAVFPSTRVPLFFDINNWKKRKQVQDEIRLIFS